MAAAALASRCLTWPLAGGCATTSRVGRPVVATRNPWRGSQRANWWSTDLLAAVEPDAAGGAAAGAAQGDGADADTARQVAQVVRDLARLSVAPGSGGQP
jgi:hypothetical protein